LKHAWVKVLTMIMELAALLCFPLVMTSHP
jgi:hypothetical protein